MSAKRPPTPPAGESLFSEDDLYTGQPCMPDQDDALQHERLAQKGRNAYAAVHDEMPPFTPKESGFAAGGGLFAAGTDPEHTGDLPGQSGVADILSVVSQDVLREECDKRVCPECPVKKDAEEARLRALAELDNARKRLTREFEERVRFAAENVLADIMPSLDNLDLALQHAANQTGACKDFVIGVEMTRKLLLDALGKHGLERVGTVGEEFNPAFHEAVGMVEAPDVPDGHICGLLSNGYKLKDRLLRPAKVMVCKK